MNAPKISIGLMVYNGADVVRRAITGVLKQSFQEWDLIISDDCSTDNSLAICRELAATDQRIRLFPQAMNQGLSGNFAFVASQNRSKYFTWLGQDDFYGESNYLEELFNVAERGHFDLTFPAIRKFKMVNGSQVDELTARVPDIDSNARTFVNHKQLMMRAYIGYQLIYGLNTRAILDLLPLWLMSGFEWSPKHGERNIKHPDEEPLCHFIFSRYRYGFAEKACYTKDMTTSYFYRTSYLANVHANFWNTLAVTGVISQAPYLSTEKWSLIFWKVARSIYVVMTLTLHEIGKWRGKRSIPLKSTRNP